ncbi:hypothetical protein H6P81_002791 [Aristolochia fimbriata]|uniref:Uncharacterized protein n=1 Tax=Aristolochia fimbriata TaxID=158543 RepID=A0AAV7FFA9_ARIFI|nr:hypothetical protein H6P81_002791 [Aristolochia fimbriata]
MKLHEWGNYLVGRLLMSPLIGLEWRSIHKSIVFYTVDFWNHFFTHQTVNQGSNHHKSMHNTVIHKIVIHGSIVYKSVIHWTVDFWNPFFNLRLSGLLVCNDVLSPSTRPTMARRAVVMNNYVISRYAASLTKFLVPHLITGGRGQLVYSQRYATPHKTPRSRSTIPTVA